MDFYCMMLSAPCRGALLTANAVGVKLNIKKLNLLAGEQMKPEYLALNPQHTVPTIVDGDLVLWESRAVSSYLANKYGKDDSLYPKLPKERAQVDRLLYFDMGTLYDRFSKYAYPRIFAGGDLEPAKLKALHEALGYLNTYLAGHDYAVGNKITIADHALVASVATFVATGIDIACYSNITAWVARCEQNMPGYEVNTAGAAEWGAVAKPKMDA